MSNLNQIINDNENEPQIIEEKYVFIVNENDTFSKNNKLFVFATLDAAKQFILRKIGEFKDEFITSSWHLNVVNDNCVYKITSHRWILGFFFYECLHKTFTIDEEVIRF